MFQTPGGRSGMDQREAYERVAGGIVDLLDDDIGGVAVPTCPGWTVKDVIGHLAGFFAAYRSAGPEAFGPGWGDKEVEARKDRSLQECLDEWRRHLRDPAGLFESHLGPVAVSDALAHEQDIRNALDRPGGRDDESIIPAIEMALAFLEKRIVDADLPTLRIITENLDRTLGDGDPDATLRTSSFELFRVLHGRRTVDQVRALQWEGDPGEWTSALFLFGPATKRVEG
jgi:uncharacterized protein (TIGR03083 family)